MEYRRPSERRICNFSTDCLLRGYFSVLEIARFSTGGPPKYILHVNRYLRHVFLIVRSQFPSSGNYYFHYDLLYFQNSEYYRFKLFRINSYRHRYRISRKSKSLFCNLNCIIRKCAWYFSTASKPTTRFLYTLLLWHWNYLVQTRK